MTTSIDQAVMLFQQGFICSQAVLAAYASDLDLPRETALKIAAGFGGGMGRSGEVCGAVSGSISCRDLLSCDLGQPEGLQHAREAQLFATRCPLFVRDAAEIVSALIGE